MSTRDTPESAASVARAMFSFALRDYDALQSSHTAGPDALRLRLSCFLFACNGFEARLNELYAGSRVDPRPDVSLDERLEALLARRDRSRRRRRLLRDVMEFREAVLRPPAVRLVEQMSLSEADAADAPPSWLDVDDGVLLEQAPRVERYRPAELPANPLLFDGRHLRTALLVLLEHLVVAERGRASRPMLMARRDGALVPVAGWFDELRRAYDGPHAAYFRRIRTGPAA